MTKECLELIFSEVEAKSQRMNKWKGLRKTHKPGKLKDKYLKIKNLFLFAVEVGNTYIRYIPNK